MPEIEELSPGEYYRAVSAAIAGQPRWEVLGNEMTLWFFSFAKFLMYRDLEPENWPQERKLEGHPLVRAILGDGFQAEPPLCGDDDKIDGIIRPIDMVHVLDADSSQALAVEEVRQGRNLVIQGPPGTGKSQTIANMIAAAVKAGKSVLFVAEKMAALEVVRRRLGNIGLGDMCLELHSNKANKRNVLQDLERTLALGQPQVQDVQNRARNWAPAASSSTPISRSCTRRSSPRASLPTRLSASWCACGPVGPPLPISSSRTPLPGRGSNSTPGWAWCRTSPNTSA